MPNVMGRQFPYTPQGVAAAQQYSQSLGMRDGGPMGFRPVGYQVGGPVGYAEGGTPMDKETRGAVIEFLMSMTGMTDPTPLLELSDAELVAAKDKVSQPQVAAPQMSAPQVSAPQMSAPQVSAPQMSAPQQIPNFPGVVPNETGSGYDYYPPTDMYNGGLMSLRRR